MNKPKIGLLPLYLELYDKTCAKYRPKIDEFYGSVAGELERLGLSVVRSPVCRVKSEFFTAIRSFEKSNADAIVTLHLAYSPSLESSDALAASRLPIIVLDTTPSFEFGPGRNADDIMYNHGIHGVQDMCNLLLRNRKNFKIEAGHWKRSDVLSRVASLARSARIASSMREARVGRMGGSFSGMGDFSVPAGALKRTIGITVRNCEPEQVKKIMRGIGAEEIRAEMAASKKLFKVGAINSGVLRESVLTSLAVRRWLREEELTAFTMNFLSVSRLLGLPTVPFMEASMAMARGIGYAGEGDVLTAALVGALLSSYPSTTFTEMFCPDWQGNRIFLSHMGEVNVNLLEGKASLCAPPFPFAKAGLPVKPAGRLRGGRAVFVNLAPQICLQRGRASSASYRMIIAPVEMDSSGSDKLLKESIRGWFRPRMDVADFLAAYSNLGGTHHAALVYGQHAREIAAFGGFMGWKTVMLQ